MDRSLRTFKEKSGFHAIFNVLIVTLFLAAIIGLNRDLSTLVKFQFDKASRDSIEAASFRWHPDLYRILSFGHVPASVDWLLIRFLTDGNISKIKDERESEASRILNLATEVDPGFFSLYTAGSNFLAIVRNDLYGARKLIDKGATFFREGLPAYPASFRDTEWGDAWRIFMIQGYIYLLEFQDIENAAKAYGAMDQFENLPIGLRGITKSIRTTEGQFRIALNSISAIKNWYAEDPVVTQELLTKEKLLQLGQSLFKWNTAFEKFPRIEKEAEMARFTRFKSEQKIPDRDSLGGRIFFDKDGKIASDTPRSAVFGIHF